MTVMYRKRKENLQLKGGDPDVQTEKVEYAVERRAPWCIDEESRTRC